MAQILKQKYRGYIPTQLQYRSSCPSFGYITTTENGILCSNMSITQISNVLNANTYNLKSLCTHPNINKWSAFGPIKHLPSHANYFDSSLIFLYPTNNFKLSDFAGYNHNALIPGISRLPDANIWVNSGNYAEFLLDISLGEIHENYPCVLLLIRNKLDGTIFGRGYNDISGITDYNITLYAISKDPVYSNTDCSCYIYVAETSTNDIDYLEDTVAYIFPNTTSYATSIKILQASEWHYDGDAQTDPPNWIIDGEGMNWTTGYWSWTNASYTGSNTVTVTATLYDANYNPVNESYIDSLIYEDTGPFYDVGPKSAYLGMSNIPNYGYHVIVKIYESS